MITSLPARLVDGRERAVVVLDDVELRCACESPACRVVGHVRRVTQLPYTSLRLPAGISRCLHRSNVDRVIDWRPNAPKWEQIAEVIRARIADGTYPPDTAVPSEHALVREFGVARATARKVLVRLREAGVIYTVRGMGSFVTPPDKATDQRAEA